MISCHNIVADSRKPPISKAHIANALLLYILCFPSLPPPSSPYIYLEKVVENLRSDMALRECGAQCKEMIGRSKEYSPRLAHSLAHPEAAETMIQ